MYSGEKMKLKKQKLIIILISTISLLLSFFRFELYGLDLIWITILFCGFPLILEALIELIRELNIKTDVLVAIAIISSVLIGEVFAAGEIALIMTIGEYLEDLTLNKTNSQIKKLINLKPKKGKKIKNYGKTNEKEVLTNVNQIRIGEYLKVLPGETIPIDGKIINGKSSIDQSLLTGEPLPIDKSEGEKVFSGTINLYSPIIIKVTSLIEDSSLEKMIKLVKSTNVDDSNS